MIYGQIDYQNKRPSIRQALIKIENKNSWRKRKESDGMNYEAGLSFELSEGKGTVN